MLKVNTSYQTKASDYLHAIICGFSVSFSYATSPYVFVKFCLIDYTKGQLRFYHYRQTVMCMNEQLTFSLTVLD
jgi:hypothetical protein